MANFFNKVWSGLDFWNKQENQGQRQQFAQSDEEDRKRRQQQAAQASVVRQPTPNTPGLQSTNTEVKPIQAGSQSDFTPTKTPGQTFDLTKPLQKNTMPFSGVQAPNTLEKVNPSPQPQAQPTVQPKPTTPTPQVPHTPTVAPNPVEIRQKATTYQNPNVQDVNNYYGNDLKVLNEELAKGDNADLHRVSGLMQSLDNRKKELADFHAARADNTSFKTARQLGDTIKNTRGDWTKQSEQLKSFWDGVSKNEKTDFEQFLQEKGLKPEEMNNPMMLQAMGIWKNGNGQNFTPDFSGDHKKVQEVQDRQKIADVMTDPKVVDIPLDTIPGNKTTAMHLRDFKSASPSDQATQLSDLEAIIRNNEVNYSANPEMKRKADQAYMLYNTLLDSGTQRQDWHTRLDAVGQTAGKFGDAIMASPKRYVQSVDALTREVMNAPQKGDQLTADWQAGRLTDEEYNKQLNANTRDTAWAGDGSQGRGHDFLVAAGTSADIVSTFLPVLSAADAAKGALVAEKMAGELAVKEGVSRTVARQMIKQELTNLAEGGAKDSLKATMAKEGLANAGFSAVGSLRDGNFDPAKTAQETVTGGVIGAGAPVVGNLLGKVGGRVLQKFRPSAELPTAVEDIGRVTSHLDAGVADSTARASYMTAEQSSKIAELERIVDDPNMPAYQKLGAKNELHALETEVDKKMTDALSPPDSPVDTTPAFEHRNEIQKIIDDGQFQLESYLNTIPNATPQEVDAAIQAAKNDIIAKTDALKAARYQGMNADVNIPDPTSPITLAKADGTQSGGILPDSFSPAPLQKVDPATLEAPVPKADATPAADVRGNDVLTTDVQRAQQLADAGVAPAVGASPTARTEQQMANAADTAARNQVDLTNPTTGATAPNQTAERVLADPNVPADTKTAISNLTHEVHSDEIMIPAAQNLVKNDLNTARQMFDSGSLISSMNLDGHVHLGNSLVEEYNRIGNTAEAAAVYNDLISATSRIGQGLRAAQAISKISPQGIVEYAANIAGKQGKHLTPELEAELVQTSQAVAKMAPGEEKAAAITEMLRLAQQPTFGNKAGDFIKGVLSAPRGLMATGDLSFAVRQGGVLGSRYPKEWAAALKNSAQYAVSNEAFQKGMTDLANLTDQSGEHLLPVFQKMELSMPAVTGKSEEVFGNTSVLESNAMKKIGVGHVVAGSDRAFSGAAAELRANVAKKIIDGYGGVKALENWTEKDLKDLGRVLNTATGRGMGSEANFAGRWFEKAAPTLSDTLFSARLWKSRLDLLNPVYYLRLAPAARKVALQSSASFGALVSAVLGAGAAAGANIEMDPRSSDFGKIKVGNTRYDIMGGLQQNIVLAARELTGEKKSADGTIVDLTEGGFGKPNRFTTLSDFVTNKETPVLATATRLLKNKDIAGNPVNPWTEVAKLFIPLGIGDVNALVQDKAGNGDGSASPADALKNYGNLGNDAKAVAQAAPSFVGVGVQTYGGSTQNVAPDGKVDPTMLEPKNLKKYEANVNKQFTKGLSKDEQRVYNLTKDDKLQKLAIEKGTVSQDQIDKVLAKENQALEKAGLPTNAPKMDTKESIQAHVENGEFDTAIKAIDRQIAANQKDKNVPKSKTEELQVDKKRLQVTNDRHYSPDIIKKYESVSLSEWRNMTDPESDEYDPKTAGMLQSYDQDLTKAGVSRGKQPDLTKYFAKGARGKGGSGSSSPKLDTNIATNKVSFDGFTPQKAQSASNSAPQSSIPTLQKVANYSRPLKKISTSKGGR